MYRNYFWLTASIPVILFAFITVGVTKSIPVDYVYTQNGSNMTQPETGQTIAWQGTVSSFKDPLKGHESHQVAVILPPEKIRPYTLELLASSQASL